MTIAIDPSLLYDPDFSQQFTVTRRSGAWQLGVFVETPTTIAMTGVVVPASAQEIMQQPEGDRSTAMMKFISAQPIYVTRTAASEGGPATSDEITWRGESYRVMNVQDYADYGYWEAFAVYMEGD